MARFGTLDANSDGELTRDELMKQAAARRPGRPAAPGARGRPWGPPSAASVLGWFDKNKDGKLTKDELPGPLAARILAADADGDGAVTAEELEAHRKQHAPGSPSPENKPAEENKPGGETPAAEQPSAEQPSAEQA
jgi:hypothetical protein